MPEMTKNDNYQPMSFDAIKIGLASPETILEWSHGEVTKPETINYRTLKPEKDGLYCEKIFGPSKDWECHCGKYKKIRYKGVVCDRCGVEVTKSSVRRERMGHIKLAAPVSHIWYFKGIPSRMGLILDLSPRTLEKVLYFASYIVLDPGKTELMYKQVLSEKEYQDMKEKYPLRYDHSQLTGPYIIEKLYELTKGDAIITTEVGQNQMWAAQYFKYKEPRTFLSSGGLGTMGYGLGAAIGAKMGRPDKTVVNIAGDGCFRMNMNEIATAVRCGRPLIEIVLNNHVLGMVRQWQTLFYDHRYSHTILNDAVDFVKLAEAMGAKAIRITKMEEVEPALKEALACPGPIVLDCMIDQDLSVFPMVPAGASIDDIFDEEDMKNNEQSV